MSTGKKPTYSARGLLVYLKDGWSEEFNVNLQQLSRYLWHRYARNYIDLEEYTAIVAVKVYTMLSQNVFNPDKGNFISFLYTLGRNEATKICSKLKNSKNKIKTSSDDFENTCAEYPNYVEDSTYTTYFLDICNKRGLIIDREALIRDVIFNVGTPLVDIYLWMKTKYDLVGEVC